MVVSFCVARYSPKVRALLRGQSSYCVACRAVGRVGCHSFCAIARYSPKVRALWLKGPIISFSGLSCHVGLGRNASHSAYIACYSPTVRAPYVQEPIIRGLSCHVGSGRSVSHSAYSQLFTEGEGTVGEGAIVALGGLACILIMLDLLMV